MDKERTKTELNENSVLEVYCIDRCYGFCGDVKFFRDGKRLLSADDLRINITSVTNDNSTSGQQERMALTITNATVNDSGLYRCELEFERPSVFDSINITVKGRTCFLSDAWWQFICYIYGAQGWHSGESTRLPLMWRGFDSQPWRLMWVEFVGSLLCMERFFSGYSGLLSPQKNNI